MKKAPIIALVFLSIIVFLINVLSIVKLAGIGIHHIRSSMAYHKEIHTYEEALEFAKSLDPQATVSQTYTDTSVSEEIIYGETSFREWSAIIHGVECHVATICCNDPVGEFYTRTYYKLDTDYGKARCASSCDGPVQNERKRGSADGLHYGYVSENARLSCTHGVCRS